MRKTIKRTLSLLLAVLLLCGTAPAAFAEPGEIVSGTCGNNGDNVTWELNIGTGEMTIRGTGWMKYYDNPSDVPWNAYREAICSAVIEDGVEEIGRYAFCNCKNLASVHISNDVTCISYEAFDGCKSLVSVTIPSSVATIKGWAFSYCTTLSGVVIPEGVKSIGSNAFNGCTNLSSVSVADSVTDIGVGAFTDTAYYKNAANWTDDVLYVGHHLIRARTTVEGTYSVLPGTLLIAEEAFQNCDALRCVEIPSDVRTICRSAFRDCTGVTEYVVAEGNEAFYNDAFGVLYYKKAAGDELVAYPVGSTRTSYAIPDGVRQIGEYAFYKAVNLVDVSIPEGVTSLERVLAFGHCTGLTSVTIPGSVQWIGDYTFSGCTSLSDVTIENGVQYIYDDAFKDCAIQRITIPKSVSRISSSVFIGCEYLEFICVDVENPYYSNDALGVLYNKNKTTLIRFPAGSPCTSFEFPDSVTSLETEAFDHSNNLISVTIGKNVTTIAAGAFCGCKNLASVNIPNSVIKIEGNAFIACNVLTNVTIPDSVTDIGLYAFRECTGLERVSIPDSVTVLGYGAFKDCSGLTDISIGKGITNLDGYAFAGCENLTQVIVPDNVTKIRNNAFYGCKNLARVTLGSGVTQFGGSAFLKCSSLQTVCYDGTPESRAQIEIAGGNERLLSATWYYHNHDPQNAVLVGEKAATCTEPGYTGDVGFECGVVLQAGEETPALGHDYDAAVVAPTCETRGYTVYTCTQCSDTYTTDYVDAIGHNWGGWEDETATQHTSYCLNDPSHIRYEDHNFVLNDELTTIETEEDDGLYVYECAVCGRQKTEVVAATGHEHNWVVIGEPVAPTCTEEGYTNYVCTKDPTHTKQDDYVAALGHDYQSVVTAPTCDARGCTTYTCSRCRRSYMDNFTNALGHKWNAGTVTTAPTCTASGVKTFTCQNDPTHTKKEPVPALGHDYDAVVTAPTCDARGYTTYTCSRCSDSYKDNYTNALGHNWNAGTVTTAPTCTATGVKIFTCQNDPTHTKTEPVPALGHDNNAVVTAPTCETIGFTTYTCSRCSFSFTGNETAPLGHNYVITAQKDATCTGTGFITYTCSRDSAHSYTEIVPANGHAFGAWKQTKAPTEHEYGEETRSCTVCGAKETREVAKLPRTELKLNKTSVTLIYKNTDTLTASEPVTWSSSNEKVVKVDTDGKLTTVKRGTATITAHSVQGGKTATCTVTVKYTWWQWLIIIFLFGWIWY